LSNLFAAGLGLELTKPPTNRPKSEELEEIAVAFTGLRGIFRRNWEREDKLNLASWTPDKQLKPETAWMSGFA
jgi:hypothetical protein